VIDDIDRSIIRVLQQDGRTTHRDLGRRVGLSPNAAGARMARLLDRGIISGVHAVVDQAALGRPIDAWVDCWLDPPRDRALFDAVVRDDDRVLEAAYLTGRVDYRLRVAVASPADLDQLLARLRAEAGVAETDTRLILHNVVAGRLPGG
jgi:Lrp/AsnC family transcriptional regulator, leucine-responsive regulatory protein